MSKLTFIHLPNCDTCRKAKKMLEGAGATLESRHIVEQPPTSEEFRAWVEMSGMDINKFFNSNGNKYKELGLKDKVKTASQEELFDLLASDGMLVKRPIVTDGTRVTVGFKPEDFEQWLYR